MVCTGRVRRQPRCEQVCRAYSGASKQGGAQVSARQFQSPTPRKCLVEYVDILDASNTVRRNVSSRDIWEHLDF